MFDPAKLAADLERDEGFRDLVYDDRTGFPIRPGVLVQGNPTIGIGWNLAGNPLNRERARIILAWHMHDVSTALFEALPWAAHLDEVRCRALLNMAFNLGVPGLLQFHNMLAALQDKRWADAARHARDSKWHGQVGHRAERIAKAFETGVDPAELIV